MEKRVNSLLQRIILIDLKRGDVTNLGGIGNTPASKDLRKVLDVPAREGSD